MSMIMFLERRPADGSAELSLEKAWHGLHFLLTGTADEGGGILAFLLSGGVEGSDDRGYGPSRVLVADEVKQVAEALSAVSEGQLWSKFAPDEMSDVYPSIWDEEEEELREEYVSYFAELQAFVRETAGKGLGLEIILT